MALYVALIAGGLIVFGAGIAESETPAQTVAESPAAQEVAVLQRECEAGKASACKRLGDVYRAGVGVSGDMARAAALYKQACDGRDSEGCHALALLYVHGGGIPEDPTRAAALFKQACEAGVAVACSSLGFLYDKGAGVPKDPRRAVALWDQACQQGEPSGCHNRASAFRDGVGSEKDRFRAEEFFRKACDLGLQSSCQALGEMVFESARRTRESAKGRRPSEPQEVCARHILVKVESPPRESSGEAEAEARNLAQGVLFSLKVMGNDFAELARKFSEDASTASGGGDLGCFARGVLVPEFEDAAFALKVGETSDVVRTVFGFHVIQRTNRGVSKD